MFRVIQLYRSMKSLLPLSPFLLQNTRAKVALFLVQESNREENDNIKTTLYLYRCERAKDRRGNRKGERRKLQEERGKWRENASATYCRDVRFTLWCIWFYLYGPAPIEMHVRSISLLLESHSRVKVSNIQCGRERRLPFSAKKNWGFRPHFPIGSFGN